MTHAVAAPPPRLVRSLDTAAIEIQSITKRFTSRRGWQAALRSPFSREMRTVLDDVTLRVAEGEFVGILGPNGAGKTTLFKILSTLTQPDSGRALVMGHDVVREPARVRLTLSPVVSDERSLQWRLTAHENLRLFAALHAIPQRAVAPRVNELLELVGLDKTGRQLVATFSSGMRQRLLIARALLARPRILLLDEPTRSLDPVSARTLRRFLREELTGKHGCTVLLATHNTEEAFGLCDRVAILDRGRLLATGNAQMLVQEVAEERYHAWTKDATHAAWQAIADRGLVRRVTRLGDEDGWSRVEFAAPGGPDRAAQILDLLTCAGVRLARFERVPLSLAELIEHVVASRGGAAHA